jgi:hypothetical protein
MQEIFKDIPGYEGLYQVSNFGNVKGLKRSVKRGNFDLKIKETLLKNRNDKDGYQIVNLSIENSKKTFRVHRLVMFVFKGFSLSYKSQLDTSLVIDHIDNDKKNNHLDNLQVISQRENTTKDKINGTSKYVGVTWNKKDKRWKSCIRINGKQKYLGYFTDELKASEAYQKELKKLHCGS